MRLLGFEFRKLTLRLPILAGLILFTLADLGKIWSVAQSESYLHQGDNWGQVYWEQYETYCGEITLDKIYRLLDRYRPLEEAVHDLTATSRTDVEGTLTGNLYSDKNLLERYFVNPMDRMYNYEVRAEEVAQTARENAVFYDSLGQTYASRKNAAIAQLYAGRHISDFYYTEGYRLYLNYDFSTVLVLLLLLYAVSQAFPRDRECRMEELMETTPNGGRRGRLAKASAAVLTAALFSLWFSAVDFIGFASCTNLTDAGTLPLYAADTFQETSLGLPLFSYCVLSALTRMLGFCVLGMVFLLLARGAAHALLPFAAGAGIFLACTLAGARWGYSSYPAAKVFNPYSLLVNRILYGRTEFVNLLGTPVLTWQAAIAAAVLLGLAAAALVVLPALGAGSRISRHNRTERRGDL